MTDISSLRLYTFDATQFWIDDFRVTEQIADRGAVMLTWDDSRSSVYDAAFPIMERFGMPGVSFTMTQSLGNSAFMTEGEIAELAGAGWDISCHPQRDDSASVMTPAEWRAAIEEEMAWLTHPDRNYEPNILAWPFGQWDTESMAISREYFDLAFSTSTGVGEYVVSTPYTVPRTTADGADSTGSGIPDDAEEAIDRAESTGGLATLMYHNVDEGGGLSLTSAQLEATCEYIANANVDVVTASDVVEGRYPYQPR